MTPSFSEDPQDEPIEVDPREKESDEEDIDEVESKAESPKESKGFESADAAELRLAFHESITMIDVSDVHHNREGKADGFKLSTTKAAYALANKMRIAMEAGSEFIYWFNGEIYKPDGARLADMKLCKLVGDEETIVKFREVERRMKNVLRSNLITFEPNPYLLAVKNGVVDLRTGEFREFRQEDYLLEKLNVVYDPNARCPVFCGFLESVTNQVVDRLTLIDWLAAHAIKLPLPYVLFLLGLGRNGKGLYEKLLKAFYGQPAFRDFKIDEPTKNNFAASKLFRKRGWIAAESNTTDKETVLGTEFIKLITGNGVVDGDVKYSIEGAVFEPYTQITVDTNGMPTIRDKSIGWEERIVKLNLPFLFLAALKEGDPQVKVADPDLFEKLTTPSELSGILNLIIYRAKEICRTKRITKRPGNEMLKEYGEQSNSITTFINKFCEYDSGLSNMLTEFGPIFEAFETWCQLTVSEKVDAGYFGKQLKKFCGGFEPKREKKTIGTKRVNVKYYRGLIFDEAAYKNVASILQAGFKEDNVSGVSTVSSDMSPEEIDPLIALSLVSLDKQWKVIKEKYSVIPFIEEFSSKKGETLETLETPTTGEPKKVTLGVSQEFSGNENTGDKQGLPVSELVVGINLPKTEDPEIARLRAGHQQHITRQQKRTCHICGYVSPHDLNQDMSSRDYVNAHICASCLISHRVKSKVQAEVLAAPSPQTSLGDVV